MRELFCTLTTLCFLAFPLLAAQPPPSPYGVCAHLTRGGEAQTQVEELELMKRAGLAWARTDFDWSGVQPGPETWNFESLDTVVSNAEKAGVQMLPILGYSVSFASPAHQHLDPWAKYVRALAERYGTRLPVLEVWNEENIPGFWEDPKADDYLPLLQKTYETVKAVDPRLCVALGGTAGVPLDFIGRLYELGGAKTFDIMNVHPYSHPAVPEESLEKRLGDLRTVMAKHGDAAKPVWITEIGWPTQKQRLAAPGVIKAGLKAAKPDKKGSWRILVLDDPALSSTDAPSAGLLADEVPPNARVQRVTFDALLATIDSYDVDAVILPFNEQFPCDHFDALMAYVRRGGILVECGGMPIWEPVTRKADGTWEKAKLYGEPFRDPLRIGVEAWWTKKGVIPEKMAVKFVGAAAGAPQPEEGFEAERFLTPNGLKEGDAFIPLLSGKKGDYTGVAAAVYKYNSDLKGAVVACALFERGAQGNTETKQAKMVPRANLIALRLGVERVFWYELQAPESDELDPESFFGIVHRDLSPKPAFLAYQTLTAQRPAGSANLDRPWKSADGALYYPQWKRPDGREAGAVWAYQKPGIYRLTFSSQGGITFTSHTGEPVGTPWNGNACILPLTDAPVYFSGGTLESVSADFDREEALRAMVPNSFSVAAEQYRGLLKRLEGTKDKFPRRWENGQLVTVEPKEWTSGFFPGSLWYLYEFTQDPEWKDAAMTYTAMLEQIRHYTGNHDIGFMLTCSYGNGLRLAHPDGYKEVLLDGAAALCTRFVPKLGMIRSWDTYSNPVIIDNMMNLELLMWASKQGGDQRFGDIAARHADQTNARHFRPDGSAYHVVDYNPLSGKVFGYYAGQGASADGPWARGQSWGLYGFTMMHRETRKPEYLARAIKSADFLCGHRNLPADKIPFWDYEAAEIPHAPRDVAAGAIMASALLELSTFDGVPNAARYRETAVRQLLALSSPAYRAPVGENGNFILMHGVGHLPGVSEIDVPLNYADYYFLEGLLRFKSLPSKL